MNQFIKTVENINDAVNSVVWGPVMLVLLVGTGIFLTIKTGCIQARKFGYIWKNTIGTLFKKQDKTASKKSSKNLTPFQAVSTALASTVGTGNIAGVTGAIFVGGPGAVFWMWFAAFFGMFTKFSEILLAVKHRQVDDNGIHYGGPMYYIEKGLGKNWKWLAVLFAVIAGFASFGIGNIAQSSEIAGAFKSLFGWNGLTSGIVLAVIVAIVVIGGVKLIGKIASYVVPFMAALYILAGIVVIVMRITDIPAAFGAIFSNAFSFQSVGGGIFGYTIMLAMREGFARGVFSNEAGLGSAPIAHAASDTEKPVDQAMWGVFEVFIDTIIICTITALTVILSGILDVSILDDYASKGAAAAAAFNQILPGTIGGTLMHISMIFFALTTIFGWSYYGESCWRYISGGNKVVIMIYKVVFVALCVVGATGSGKLMWDISDTLNGMMAIPNLIALLLMSGTITKMTKEYFYPKITVNIPGDPNAPIPEDISGEDE